MRLDLGSGLTPQEGHIGVDLYCGVAKDIVEATDGEIVAIDLQHFPWPIADVSVEEIWCCNYIEHQPRSLWIPFVEEIYRVLVPGGKATIVHPNAKSTRAHQDPTHLDIIPVERWLYVNKEWRVNNGLDRAPYPSAHFLVDVRYVNIDEPWMARSDEAIQFALSHYWDVAGDVVATLIKEE